ncbi:MAG TPA: dodecin family protein [Steroidobacteraceae bacterium]|nr:dodecin family protein [Steroidobacteraceae bacterium]
MQRETEEIAVAGTTQRVVRLTGTSTKSIDDAAGQAVAKAIADDLDPQWFELDGVRGWIRDGRIERFEVALRLRVGRRAPGEQEST